MWDSFQMHILKFSGFPLNSIPVIFCPICWVSVCSLLNCRNSDIETQLLEPWKHMTWASKMCPSVGLVRAVFPTPTFFIIAPPIFLVWFYTYQYKINGFISSSRLLHQVVGLDRHWNSSWIGYIYTYFPKLDVGKGVLIKAFIQAIHTDTMSKWNSPKDCASLQALWLLDFGVGTKEKREKFIGMVWVFFCQVEMIHWNWAKPKPL